MISIKYLGRFGNNLIQFFSAIILQQLLNLQTITPLENVKDGMLINEEMYYRSCNLNVNNVLRTLREYYNCSDYTFSKLSECIILNDYCQRSNHLFEHRGLILRVKNNEDLVIYTSYQNGDQIREPMFYKEEKDRLKFYFKDLFAKHIQNDMNDIVLHIRLGDFNKKEPLILNPEFYVEQLKTFKERNVLIIVETPKNELEYRYIDYIIKRSDKECRVQNTTCYNDWLTIRNARYIINSNSTYSWSASFLNERAEKIVFPDTDIFENQKLERNDERWTTIFIEKEKLINLENFFKSI
jgi:uncharacterized protein YeeX (DUF496 family)